MDGRTKLLYHFFLTPDCFKNKENSKISLKAVFETLLEEFFPDKDNIDKAVNG
jgi:hypothetical protein